MQLYLYLSQQISLILLLIYLLAKTPLVRSLSIQLTRPVQFVSLLGILTLLLLFAFMQAFPLTIPGTTPRQFYPVTVSPMLITLAGLFGGLRLGIPVAVVAAMIALYQGDFADIADAVSALLQAMLAGIIHLKFLKQIRPDATYAAWLGFFTCMLGVLLQMLMVMLLGRPSESAVALLQILGPPSILLNALGVSLTMLILRDQIYLRQKISLLYSKRALRIAERTVSLIHGGFNETNCARIAAIIRQEIEVAAVAITSDSHVLAFDGLGHEHHLTGLPISDGKTLLSLRQNRVIFVDGIETPYRCSLSPDCPLGSVLIIPMQGADDKIFGTIKLYEAKGDPAPNINRTMGEGIGQLLASQFLYGQLEEQKHLLKTTELKQLQAQVNPHFLFNALNTIAATIRRQPDRARELILHLSRFFRTNLKDNTGNSSLADELAHIKSYLEIEQTRFGDRLQVEYAIDPVYDELLLPSLTLQPVIENAVKHGISQLLADGHIRIYSDIIEDTLNLVIEDNAGRYANFNDNNRKQLDVVDRRLKSLFGHEYGLKIDCKPDEYTRVHILVPLPKQST